MMMMVGCQLHVYTPHCIVSCISRIIFILTSLKMDDFVVLSDVEMIPNLILSANTVYAATTGHFKTHYSQV
mgnify:CR=1 FL=1